MSWRRYRFLETVCMLSAAAVLKSTAPIQSRVVILTSSDAQLVTSRLIALVKPMLWNLISSGSESTQNIVNIQDDTHDIVTIPTAIQTKLS